MATRMSALLGAVHRLKREIADMPRIDLEAQETGTLEGEHGRGVDHPPPKLPGDNFGLISLAARGGRVECVNADRGVRHGQ